ncbi:hypothetical protein [Streptomyces sp. RKAG290]|uniref:hypothetical protein n=1 Tax=Streptomyces sp. RKAG290 TaxID=2888348 RepID=UPI0020344CB0|nr:hypothetical protein [Streptomyces sp. RKAG290]MCM2410739.1 hypothetical protein [Streptomyces sp. RKAG290]
MRGGRALGATLAVALLSAGCGIRATDVVEAGEPAIVEVVPARPLGTLLYFVSSSSASRLLPVVRPGEPLDGSAGAGSGEASAGADKALSLLFAGPSKAERDAGLRSELPHGRVELSVRLSAQGVQVTLDAPVNGLSETARQQLFCTAAQARTADRGEAVTVTGTDGVIGPAHCSV